MGADATVATGGRLEGVRGGLEATGTGIKRLSSLDLAYPVFNWDEAPIKQGLHNRHPVGLMAMNTFLAVSGLSLYGKTVLVVGYDPVGRGAADAARHFGAVVEVCDTDPAASLAAAHRGSRRRALRTASRAPTPSSPRRAATAPSPSKPSPTARAVRSSLTSATRAASCPSPGCETTS